jgi:hypothetical protein
MNVAHLKSWLASAFTILLLISIVNAQSSATQAAPARTSQSTATSLASLPDADTIIYLSPQRILNEAAPKVVPATDLANLRATLVDWKRSVGIDPSTIEYVTVAVRFHKPTADLSFVPPDVLAVAGGDFSADSLITLASLYLQDKARTEKYGSKTLTIMKIDPIAAEAAKNPLLKSFVEMGIVALNANTLAFGNIDYLKAAVDAAEGNGRITSAALGSLLRNPNALVSAAGSPLTAFAKSFGVLGTQTTPRDNGCETKFGDFYAAITMEGTNFSLRGAINTDNPDTAKIINGLISGLFQQAMSYVPDQETQNVLKNISILPKESEIVFEADVPDATIASLIRNQTKDEQSISAPKKPAAKPRRRARRK